MKGKDVVQCVENWEKMWGFQLNRCVFVSIFNICSGRIEQLALGLCTSNPPTHTHPPQDAAYSRYLFTAR